jgi:hypothetical protein
MLAVSDRLGDSDVDGLRVTDRLREVRVSVLECDRVCDSECDLESVYVGGRVRVCVCVCVRVRETVGGRVLVRVCVWLRLADGVCVRKSTGIAYANVRLPPVP